MVRGTCGLVELLAVGSTSHSLGGWLKISMLMPEAISSLINL
jgi:hypothetical protein